MPRANTNDLVAFVAVARERSFTRAAAQLGVSQSALSHTITGLESRLGLRLLTRTTRSVSATEAGERLFNVLQPHFEGIETAVAALSDFKDRPSGTIRITAGEHSASSVLWPALKVFLPKYPEISVEIVVDYGLSDIVAERYDAGVRLGEQLAKDMIAVRIAADMRMAVVGAPAYFKKRKQPKSPRDLTEHSCINLRLPTYGGIYAWEFERRGRELKVRTEGPLVFNNLGLRIDAALAGLGLAYLPEDAVLDYINKGTLVRVLDDWCAPFPGYHIYYPSRRQPTAAFALLIDALRYRG
jgi:DNA-binding transcriptional LysR family regulator